jgi:heterodisulfide reductase subunit C
MVLRNLAVKAGYMAEPHKRAAGVMVKTGHLIPFDDKGRENRRKVGLDEVPPTSLSRKEALKELEGIVRKTGFSDILKIEKGKGK